MDRRGRGPGSYWRDHWPMVAVGIIGIVVSIDTATPMWVAIPMVFMGLALIAVAVVIGMMIWKIDRDIRAREDRDDS